MNFDPLTGTYYQNPSIVQPPLIYQPNPIINPIFNPTFNPAFNPSYVNPVYPMHPIQPVHFYQPPINPFYVPFNPFNF